jgi:hypothetical protein
MLVGVSTPNPQPSGQVGPKCEVLHAKTPLDDKLISLNSKYKPIILRNSDELYIHGKVVG